MSLEQDLRAAFKKTLAKKMNVHSLRFASQAVKREAAIIGREKALQGTDENGKRLAKSKTRLSKWKARLLALRGEGNGNSDSTQGMAKRGRLKIHERKRLANAFWNTIGFIAKGNIQ